MPESKLVISDTSPLLNLALIDKLELLEKQFENIKVPEQVWKELQEGEKGRKKLEGFKESGFFELVKVEEDELFHEILEEGNSVAEA